VTEIVIPKAFDYLWKPKRYKGGYGGRGSAKSHSFARTLLVMGARTHKRIVCGREIQKSIKDSVHQLLSDIIISHPALRSHYHVQDTEIVGKNGSTFIFRGLRHNTRDLKSLEGADILWIEEAENVSDSSYEIIIPTLRKEGSEIWATWNTKNLSDPTHRRFVTEADEDTETRKVSWRDNPFFTDVMRKEMEKLKRNDYEAYRPFATLRSASLSSSKTP
jgi:phage terminase large subunit